MKASMTRLAWSVYKHYPRPKIWQKSDFTNTNQRPNYQIITLVFIILLQKSLKKSIWAADLVLCTISQYDVCSQSLSYNPGQKGLGHFPFCTCLCMEFAANLQYTLINTALTRFFLHPTPLPPVWTTLRSLMVARYTRLS